MALFSRVRYDREAEAAARRKAAAERELANREAMLAAEAAEAEAAAAAREAAAKASRMEQEREAVANAVEMWNELMARIANAPNIATAAPLMGRLRRHVEETKGDYEAALQTPSPLPHIAAFVEVYQKALCYLRKYAEFKKRMEGGQAPKVQQEDGDDLLETGGETGEDIPMIEDFDWMRQSVQQAQQAAAGTPSWLKIGLIGFVGYLGYKALRK